MQIGLELAKNYFLTPPNADDKELLLFIFLFTVGRWAYDTQADSICARPFHLTDILDVLY